MKLLEKYSRQILQIIQNPTNFCFSNEEVPNCFVNKIIDSSHKFGWLIRSTDSWNENW